MKRELLSPSYTMRLGNLPHAWGRVTPPNASEFYA
ncbi:hypothetical protein [Serratia plymuthica]|nr:hypothetical protein [Serratia plymuthica]